MRYAVVIEKARGNYSAYVPDLPGCIATGRTRATVMRRMREAVVLHLRGMRDDGTPIPRPNASADYVQAAPVRRRAG